VLCRILVKLWEGSTTVVYTVVWRKSVVWWEGLNTALWLVRRRVFCMCPVWIASLCVPFQPITTPYLTFLIKPRIFAKRQCKLQWLTPPKTRYRYKHEVIIPAPSQSARLAYLSWKIETGRDWYRSQIGRDLWAKVKMCTPVHGLSGFFAIKQTESPCAGVHIFTFAP